MENKMIKKFLISGGFGDAINQFIKIYEICLRENIPSDSVCITYHRDLIDKDLILKDGGNPKTYEVWGKAIAELQGWQINFVEGHVTEYFKKHGCNYDYRLGTLFSDIEVPDQQRGGFYGRVPEETSVELTVFPTPWKFNRVQKAANFKILAIHSEFADERSMPQRAWHSAANLLNFIKILKERHTNLSVYLFGNTKKHDISLFEKLSSDTFQVINWMNRSVVDQFSLVLSSDCVIGFSGWAHHTPASAGIKLYAFKEHDMYAELYYSPLWRKNNHIIEWENNAPQAEFAKEVII